MPRRRVGFLPIPLLGSAKTVAASLVQDVALGAKDIAQLEAEAAHIEPQAFPAHPFPTPDLSYELGDADQLSFVENQAMEKAKLSRCQAAAVPAPSVPTP